MKQLFQSDVELIIKQVENRIGRNLTSLERIIASDAILITSKKMNDKNSKNY